MNLNITTPNDYIDKLPEERKRKFSDLRDIIKENLPEGFEETILYNMISYVVPHKIYPAGYHVNPDLPLPFISIASQKDHIAIYHNGIYVDEEFKNKFISKYKNEIGKEPDIGKSCIRFKVKEDIPFDLIKDLIMKITPIKWIKLYESSIQQIKK